MARMVGGRRLAMLAVALCLTAACLFAGSATAMAAQEGLTAASYDETQDSLVAQDGSTTETWRTVNFNRAIKLKKLNIKWDWNELLQDATQAGVSKNLLVASIVLCEEAELSTELSSSRVETAMAEIGFSDVMADSKTTPTRAYGHKSIVKDGEEYHVICAVFTESKSTTLVTGSKDGFLEAGQKCKLSLANYVSTIPGATKDNTILFITGYNGGAAAANIAGRLSGDLAKSSATFVYTFASPNYECGNDPNMKAPNFHTFTNTDDDVTKRPQEQGTIGKHAIEEKYTYSSLVDTRLSNFNKVYLYLAGTLYVDDVDDGASANNLCQTYMSFALCELSDEELERYLGMSRENGISLTTKDAKVNPNEKTVLKRPKILAVSGAQGAVTYSKSSGDSGISVSKNGNVTVKKSVTPGTYHVGISASAAGDEFYKPKTVNKTVKITVKRVNTITVTPRTATVAAGKKVALSRSDVLTLTNAKGAVTYTKKSGNEKISIEKTSGKVTIKKGLKKGKTYKVKVAVKAAGDDTYAPKTVTKTFAIRMKA